MRRELGQFLAAAGTVGILIEGAIKGWLRTVEGLGDQGRLAETPAATRDNPNLAPAFDTRNRVRQAQALARRVIDIHFPVNAAISRTGRSCGFGWWN